MIIAILIGALGAPLALLLSFPVARAIGARRAPAPLRAARDQLAGTLGPGGAALTLFGAGIFMVTGLGIVLGELLQRLQDPVDWWTFDQFEHYRDGDWARWMDALGTMGDIPQTRVTTLMAIVLLTPVAVFLRRRWWEPAALVGGPVLVQYFLFKSLAGIVDRGHPPLTTGTYPSGGCGRTLVLFGSIMLVVLAYARAGRSLRAAGWSLVVGLTFAEGYTRLYLNKHWITDVFGGWVIGGMMLTITIFAGHVLLDRPGYSGQPTGRTDGSHRSPDEKALA